MSGIGRVVTTALIWMASPFVIAASAPYVEGFDLVVLVGIVMTAASVSTRFIWYAGLNTPVAETAEKSKRAGSSRRVRRLIDALSDDELDELRARLAEDDGSVPLNSLLEKPAVSSRR